MISKIKSIKNIGSFFLFDWDTLNPSFEILANGQQKLANNNPIPIDNNFKKFNIFFGENGSGKSTLVKILKSLNADEKEILSKNWDHTSKPSGIEIISDINTIIYDDVNYWKNNNLKDKILFFDRSFIDNFVHSFPSGRGANHNKKTGGLILYLGNFYQYKKQLENLTELKKILIGENTNLTNIRDQKFASLKPDFSYDEVKFNFNKIKLADIPNIPNLLKDKQQELNENIKLGEQMNQKYSQSTEISRTNDLILCSKFILPNEKDIKDSFAFSVGSSTVSTISKITGKEDFIKEGVKLIHNHTLTSCPFCDQEIKKGVDYLDNIKEYEKIFDAEFLKNQEQASSFLYQYREQIINIISFKEPAGNLSLNNQINKLLLQENIIPEIKLEAQDLDILNKELLKIEDKQKNLSISETSRVLDIIDILNKINLQIESYNLKIRDINSSLSKAKQDISSGDLIKQQEANSTEKQKIILDIFTYTNYLRIKDIYNISDYIEKNNKTINKLDNFFDIFRKKVESLFIVFVDKYFLMIEKNLELFCPGLELKVKGVTPKYDLRVGDVTCGLEVHYKNTDRLKDLSEGEKQSIALSYFLAYISKISNKDDTIIVFDDPINSFDAGKRKQASQMIFAEAINFKQLFLLTCDSLFKSYCLKAFNKKIQTEKQFYYILKSASSAIYFRPKCYLNIYTSFRNDFKSSNINSVLGTDENIVIYGQKLRYCLEEIKDRYLGYSEDSFDNIMTRVKANMSKLNDENIDKILEIYSYCNTGGLAHFPKDGQTSWNEIKFQVAKYMDMKL